MTAVRGRTRTDRQGVFVIRSSRFVSTRRRFLAAASGLAVVAAHNGRGVAFAQEATPAPEGGWTFVDDRGATISLPARPERIVAQSTSAALWDYGIRPIGVFGPQRNPDGSNAADIGDVDLDSVAGLSEAWDAFDVEGLLALDADLVVGPLHPDGDISYLLPEFEELLGGSVPVLGILFTGGVSANHILERYEELAAALGADLQTPEVVAAREEFDAAVADLRDAIAGNPGLTVMAIAGTSDGMVVANASFAADLVFLKELGLDIVQHGEEGMWEQLSWEQADKHEVDLILVDARSNAMTREEYAAIGTWASLPAVQAGQLGPWRTELPYSRRAYAEYLRELAEVIRAADAGIV